MVPDVVVVATHRWRTGDSSHVCASAINEVRGQRFQQFHCSAISIVRDENVS